MTYKDILDQIRQKDSSFFLEEIRKKESRKKKNTPEIINSYLKKLEDLLFSYENWFGSKLGRNSEKRTNRTNYFAKNGRKINFIYSPIFKE
jgi:hypothetical protein